MNFPLQYLESHFDDESLLTGEQLAEAGQVYSLRQIERHLWIANVQDGPASYETEVKISPTKVIAATCECEHFQQHRQCGHLAATLLALRKQLSSPVLPLPSAPLAEESPRRLTVNALLEQVSHQDLVAFVKQYAKLNRNFALALKARFAPEISSIDSREKYLQLLESTITAVRRPDRTIPQRGANSLYKILSEILARIEEMMAQGFLSEAVAMAQTIIEKITPLLRKLQALEEDIRGQVQAAFEVLSDATASAPPDLRESIWNYSLRECRKLIYRNTQFDQQFFRLLIGMVQSDHEATQLLDLIEEQISRYFYENRELAKMLLTKLALLEKLGKTNEAQLLAYENIAHQDFLLLTLRHWLQKGNLSQAKTLAKVALERADAPEIIARLEEKLLKIAQMEHDDAAVVELSCRRLLQTFDFNYYKILKASNAWRSVDQLPVLLCKLKDLPPTPAQMRLLADIYHEEAMYAELLAHLQQARSLELAAAYGHLLLAHDRTATYRLYNDLFAHYLTTHVGRKPSEKIRAILHQLYEMDAEDIAETLVENLRANFPERHTLMEALAPF